MALDIKKKSDAPAVIETEFEGEKIKLSYSRTAANGAWFNTLPLWNKDAYFGMAHLKLAGVLLSWDVKYDGEDYLPDSNSDEIKALSRSEQWLKLFDEKPIPQSFVYEMLQAVVEDMRPGDKTKK